MSMLKNEPGHKGGEVEGRRERAKRERLERIREAAWSLFVEKGYEATTTREVAERADVGAGTVFLYAKEKRELLFLVMEEELSRVTEAAFARLPEGPLEDCLVRVFERPLALYAKVPGIARAFVRELLYAPADDAERARAVTGRFLAGLASVVEEGKRRGEVAADVDAGLAAANCFALYYLVLTSWLSGAMELREAKARLRASLALQIRGLAPSSRREHAKAKDDRRRR